MKRIVKYGIISIVAMGVLGGGVVLYLLNMPHRNVQAEDPTFVVDANEFVNQYIQSSDAANSKFLDQVGVVTGVVSEISLDQLNQKVVSLKTDKAGVNCTFMLESNEHAAQLKTGDFVKIKGVVRLGPSIDEELELVEFGVIEKCDIVNL